MKMSLAIWATALTSLALSAAPAMAEPPYEPNDTLLTAAGPLAASTTYMAGIETSNDVDYYYFYVTGPSTSQVSITLTLLTSTESYLGVGGAIADAHGNELTGTHAYGQAGSFGTASISLNPGKYYFRVSGAKSGFGYRFSTSGTTGAFGAYSTIAAQCAAAQGPVNQYQAQLATAESSLKVAKAKVKKYGESRKPKVRRKVRARLSHVKTVVKAEKESLRGAEAAESPWCFIPQ